MENVERYGMRVRLAGIEVMQTSPLMKSPAMAEKLEAQGFVPIFDTPEAFAASLKRERQMWADVIRRNQITAD